MSGGQTVKDSLRQEQLSLWREELARLENISTARLTPAGAGMVRHQILTAQQNIEYLEHGTVDGEPWDHTKPAGSPHKKLTSEERRAAAKKKISNARTKLRQHQALAERSKPTETRLDPGELSVPGRAGNTINRDLDCLRKHRYHLGRVEHYEKQICKAEKILEETA